MNHTISNPNSWVPVIPDFTNLESNRSADNYFKVCAQFCVEYNPRYVHGHQGRNETYCNIFVWDVTNAMQCEIPHWVDRNDHSLTVGTGKGKELTANDICDWLPVHGLNQGWMQCSESQARKRATAGFPTVVAWKNTKGIGHVAMVLPSSSATLIAQAGKTNFDKGPLATGFGTGKALTFFTHD